MSLDFDIFLWGVWNQSQQTLRGNCIYVFVLMTVYPNSVSIFFYYFAH